MLTLTVSVPASSGDLPPDVGNGDFTIASQNGTTVLVGQVVHLTASGPTGFGVSNEQKEMDYLWRLDDAGAVYENGVAWNNSAHEDFSPRIQKAWTTPGVKSTTCTAISALATKTKTLPITVVDPDTVAWDRDIYVSFAGNTTGWPTAGGAVQHITSKAAWDALTFNTNGEDVRVTFRDDEVYGWTTASDKRFGGRNARYYVVADFAGTDRPLIRAVGAASSSHTAFEVDCDEEPTLILYGIEGDGQYSPVTGLMPNGHLRFITWQQPSGANTADISVFKCGARGASFIVGQGIISDNGPTLLGVADCWARDHADYALGQFGGKADGGAVGCDFPQNDLALLRDGKPGWPGNQGPDHHVRWGCMRNVSMRKCRTFSRNGWSAFNGDVAAIQSGVRMLPCGHNDPWEAYLMGNEIYSGRQGVLLGDINSTNTVDAAGKALIARNRVYIGRQARNVFYSNCGGTVIINNVGYHANLTHPNGRPATAVQFANGSGPTSVGAEDSYIGFNTFRSDATVDDYVLFDDDWSRAGAVQFERNLMSVGGHENGNSFTEGGPLSPGDNFKPVAGSPAIDAVPEGAYRPVRDHDGNLRGSGVTSEGAHHDSVVSAQSVPAPVYNGGLTIAELPIGSGEYHVTDLGDWTNGDGRFIEWQWRLNGSPIGDSHRTTASPGSGSLTCRITMTNLGGQRVTATSNALAV